MSPEVGFKAAITLDSVETYIRSEFPNFNRSI